MKKALVMILTLVLMMSLAAPAFAVDSPTDEPSKLITVDGCTCEIVLWSERDSLSDVKKANFEASKECLEEAIPEGFACVDLVYFKMEDDCTACDVAMILVGEGEVAEDVEVGWTRTTGELVCGAYEVELPLEEENDVMVMQYLDGEWSFVDLTVENDVIVAVGLVDGPMALLMK